MADFYIIFEGDIEEQPTKDLIKTIKEAEDKYQNIFIFFSSSGGSIDLGFLLATVVQNSKVPITMHAMNHIDSIANVVYLSAKKRTAESYAKFFFHGASTSGNFDIKKLKEKISSIETSNKRIAYYISENSNLSLKKINDIMEVGSTISSPDAMKYGIVQEIIHKEIPVDADKEGLIFIE